MNHENTRLYQTSLELVGQCAELIERFPPGLGFLADQLRRASASVPLNFAEGCRKRSERERARSEETAAWRAREVSEIVAVAHGLEGVGAGERAAARDRCDQLCATLAWFRHPSAAAPRWSAGRSPRSASSVGRSPVRPSPTGHGFGDRERTAPHGRSASSTGVSARA